MGKIILVLGGARSGKSSFANQKALNEYKNIAYIATSPYFDEDMNKRIEQHKKDRPSEWPTYEETKDLHLLIKKIHHSYGILLIDCLTLYVSNYLLENEKEPLIKEKIELLVECLKQAHCNTIIVSNEVGLGVHPENELACKFRDIAGRANQIVAQKAQDVYFMLSGIPLKLKSNGINTFF